MNAELQCLEVEPTILCDDDFAVEHAASGQLRLQWLDQFGKITVQRFSITALDQDLVPIAEHQRAKPIPLRFEDPGVSRRQFANTLREHGQDRRVYRKVHISMLYRVGSGPRL